MIRKTLAEKIATCTSLEELDGMLGAIKCRGQQLTGEEIKAAQSIRGELMGKGK